MQEIRRKQFEIERKREAMEARTLLLRSEFESEESEARKVIGNEKARNEVITQSKVKMAKRTWQLPILVRWQSMFGKPLLIRL